MNAVDPFSLFNNCTGSQVNGNSERLVELLFEDEGMLYYNHFLYYYKLHIIQKSLVRCVIMGTTGIL